MRTFGIISEGPTDQIVIQNILVGYFKEDISAGINPLQPLLDTTDKNQKEATGGGWNNVFEYCKSNKFLGAFEQNDFLIIQIDSDVCEQKGFDVKRTNEDGTLKKEAALIQSIISRFQTVISTTFGDNKYEQMKNRIIFAICINEIECWILPIFYTDKTASATNNCTYKLNQKLPEAHNCFIDEDNKSNMTKVYFKISRPYTKNKILMDKHANNPSLKHFIETLIEKFPPTNT